MEWSINWDSSTVEQYLIICIGKDDILHLSNFSTEGMSMVFFFSVWCSQFPMNLFFWICSFWSFVIGYYLYLHFNCYSISWFPSPTQKPTIPSPLPLLLWGCSPSTHPLMPPHLSIPLHRIREHSHEQGPLLPLIPKKVSLCYLCS